MRRIALFTAAMLVAGLGAASAQRFPTIDFEASCRAAAKATQDRVQTVEACRNSEIAAREQLKKDWGKYSAADRAHCYALTTTGTPGTYTELLTCLEMRVDAQRLSKQGGTVGNGEQQKKQPPRKRQPKRQPQPE